MVVKDGGLIWVVDLKQYFISFLGVFQIFIEPQTITEKRDGRWISVNIETVSTFVGISFNPYSYNMTATSSQSIKSI